MNNRFYALSISGGRGERLRPLTDDRPKSMVEIDGKPIVKYQMDWMKSHGVTDVVFLCGYKGAVIQNYIGDGSQHGITAHYSFEDSPLGRGGALKRGLHIIPENIETVLVVNGDVLTNQPLAPIIKLHERSGAMGTIMLVPHPSQYGVVESDDQNVVTQFIEKGRLPFWINAGVYIFNREIEQLLPDVGDHETTVFQDLAKDGRLTAFHSDMVWTSVENQKDLQDLTDRIREGRLSLAGL